MNHFTLIGFGLSDGISQRRDKAFTWISLLTFLCLFVFLVCFLAGSAPSSRLLTTMSRKAPLWEFYLSDLALSGVFMLLLMALCFMPTSFSLSCQGGDLCSGHTNPSHTEPHGTIIQFACFIVCASLSHQHGFASCLWAYVTEDQRQESFLFSVSRPCPSVTLGPFITPLIQWSLFYSCSFCVSLPADVPANCQ